MVADLNFDHIGLVQRRAGALIDTNMLVLLIVGRYAETKIQAFRATRKYDLPAFRALSQLVAQFARLYATPNIMTETDNLLRQSSEREWPAISRSMQEFAQGSQEEPFASITLLEHDLHPKIGLTDCSAIEIATRGIMIITDDLQLNIALTQRGLPVFPFSHYIGRGTNR